MHNFITDRHPVQKEPQQLELVDTAGGKLQVRMTRGGWLELGEQCAADQHTTASPGSYPFTCCRCRAVFELSEE